MKRSLRISALVLAALSLGGCQMVSFTISIPDFASKRVAGVWMWRWSTASGAFQRQDQLVFGEVDLDPTGESLDYVVTPVAGGQDLPFTAHVARDGANPDRVTLQLLFTRSQGTGYYRASTFNATGESPLSAEVLPL